MSLKITKDCINCGACELECPNKAIYEGGKKWQLSEGTSIKEKFILNKKNKKVFKYKKYYPIKKNIYYIVKEKCTECIGFYKNPKCASVCPINCCIKDNNYYETKEELIKKKKKLHNIK
ncbi:MAG: 4Fe-4S dicluster domain-containing protein [Candidatus Shikimatogenerans bostrichidophilus]|nr:MAG: 4Fe-4S dicluster domain-containing protein [Candidatus Shikimatogenerans bostrichidophilus]